jgi:acyl-coenzyme A thioesterase PaaI-like protein
MGPFGFVPRAASEGRAVWDYDVDPAHFNINGTLHGGVMMALLDTRRPAASTRPRSSTSTSCRP